MVIFGVSNMLSDIYEVVNGLGKKVTRIITDVPEQKREPTKDLETMLQELNERPLIMPLEAFAFEEGEEYFVVPTTPKKSALINVLKSTYDM